MKRPDKEINGLYEYVKIFSKQWGNLEQIVRYINCLEQKNQRLKFNKEGVKAELLVNEKNN